MEQVLVVDTSAINTLLEVQGLRGLDTLFSSGQRVVLTRNSVGKAKEAKIVARLLGEV